MSSGPTLTTIYSEALARYEELYRDGKIKDWQLALIKQQTDLNGVLSTVKEAEAKNESERNAIERLFHRVSPQIVTKIERFSGVVDTAIQSSVLFPFPYRYWVDLR
jgi:Holliday junction resolvasome RuvABC endonuclease subunit